MAERWTCDKCNERNENVNYTCQRCGEARVWDSSPAIPEPVGPAPGPTGTRRPPTGNGRPAWLRFIWLPVLLGLIVVPMLTGVQRAGDGAITRAGSMSVHDLQVGDCFDIPEDEADSIDTVRGVPCDQPHDYEVYAIGDMDEGPYPSELDFDVQYEVTCLSAFEPYVGTPYPVSDIWAEMLWPIAEGWADGDRTITCFLFDPEGEVTGSLRSSGR